jgi:glycerol-3-phosphate acyltransferase PlsY
MILNYGLLIVAYFLGSIPFSIILGRTYKGIDVREHGSGNPGGTNSMRWLGRRMGLVVIFLDAIKAGLLVLLVGLGVFDELATSLGVEMLHPLAYGVAAAFGHVFSIFIKFKGGKAVASSVGIMMAFNPIYALITLVIFFITLRIWKYVSVASCVGVFTSILIGIFIEGLIYDRWQMVFYTIALFILVFIRHRSNFKKIKLGTESKVKIFDKK